MLGPVVRGPTSADRSLRFLQPQEPATPTPRNELHRLDHTVPVGPRGISSSRVNPQNSPRKENYSRDYYTDP